MLWKQGSSDVTPLYGLMRVNQPVTFSAVIELLPHTDGIVSAAWDCEGEGTFPAGQAIKAPNHQGRLVQIAAHAGGDPGLLPLGMKTYSHPDVGRRLVRRHLNGLTSN